MSDVFFTLKSTKHNDAAFQSWKKKSGLFYGRLFLFLTSRLFGFSLFKILCETTYFDLKSKKNSSHWQGKMKIQHASSLQHYHVIVQNDSLSLSHSISLLISISISLLSRLILSLSLDLSLDLYLYLSFLLSQTETHQETTSGYCLKSVSCGKSWPRRLVALGYPCSVLRLETSRHACLFGTPMLFFCLFVFYFVVPMGNVLMGNLGHVPRGKPATEPELIASLVYAVFLVIRTTAPWTTAPLPPGQLPPGQLPL